jgi:hypothetical protein
MTTVAAVLPTLPQPTHHPIVRTLAPRLLGKRLMLVYLTGRKSGRQYRQPISYIQDGETLLLTRSNASSASCLPRTRWSAASFPFPNVRATTTANGLSP